MAEHGHQWQDINKTCLSFVKERLRWHRTLFCIGVYFGLHVNVELLRFHCQSTNAQTEAMAASQKTCLRRTSPLRATFRSWTDPRQLSLRGSDA